MKLVRWCPFALALGSIACGSRLTGDDPGNDSGVSNTSMGAGGKDFGASTSGTGGGGKDFGASSSVTGGGGAGFPGSPGSGGTGNVGDANRDASDAPAVMLPTSVQGSWKGYIENFQFGDRSDAVLLTLTETGAGQVSFGISVAPPSATNPNVGYPPGAMFTGEPGLPSSLAGPYPGFAFTLMNVTYDGKRLQFDVAPNELWSHWCELQMPVSAEGTNGMYWCVHNWGFASGSPGECSQTDPRTREIVPIDCGKLALCQPFGVCACTAQACTAKLDASLLHFDIVVVPPSADGSVRGLDSGVHNVHLSKQ